MIRYRYTNTERRDGHYELFPAQREIQNVVRRQLHEGLPGMVHAGLRGGKTVAMADLAARWADEQRCEQIIVVGLTQAQAECEASMLDRTLWDRRFMRKSPPEVWVTGEKGFQRLLLAQSGSDAKLKIARNTVILITEATWIPNGEAMTFMARLYSDYVVAYGSPHDSKWMCDAIIPKWATWEMNPQFAAHGSDFIARKYASDRKAALRDFGCGKELPIFAAA